MHECPECRLECTCHGDIDGFPDGVWGGCTHCDLECYEQVDSCDGDCERCPEFDYGKHPHAA